MRDDKQCSPFRAVKLVKETPGKMEGESSRGAARESETSGKTYVTFWAEEACCPPTTEGRKELLLCQQQAQPKRRYHNSGHEKPPLPDLRLSSHGLSFAADPPTSLHFSLKKELLSFEPWTPRWFAVTCLSPVAMPLLFLNKPTLLAKLQAVFLVRPFWCLLCCAPEPGSSARARRSRATLRG